MTNEQQATRLDTDAIRARLDAATPGPWMRDGLEVSQHWDVPQPWTTVVSDRVSCGSYCLGGTCNPIESDADAELIANAPTDIAALLDEVDRLRRELAATSPASSRDRDVVKAYHDQAMREALADIKEQDARRSRR